MKNKLGITNNEEIRRIEYTLTNFKHKLINETFLFNEDTIFSISYLEKLHFYLFQDIYGEEICKRRNALSDECLINIQKTLNEIKKDLLSSDLSKLSNDIFALWSYQMFLDGNTRTIRAFLKIACLGYGLQLKHDFDEDIYEDYFIGRLVEEISLRKVLK